MQIFSLKLNLKEKNRKGMNKGKSTEREWEGIREKNRVVNVIKLYYTSVLSYESQNDIHSKINFRTDY